MVKLVFQVTYYGSLSYQNFRNVYFLHYFETHNSEHVISIPNCLI